MERYFATLPLFLPHIKYSLGDSSHIRFWFDRWDSSHPFSILYPNIFNLSLEKSNVISDLSLSSSWNLYLRRSIEDDELFEISSVLSTLSIFILLRLDKTLNSSLYPLMVSSPFPLSLKLFLPPLLSFSFQLNLVPVSSL